MVDRRITLIRVPAQFEIEEGDIRVAVAEFKLGAGPCGRNVAALTVQMCDAWLTIAQEHSDGSVTEFRYLLAHITGRVEVTYA